MRVQKELKNFVDNSIGIITKKRKPNLKWGETEDSVYYTIRYDNIPEKFKRFFINHDSYDNDEKTFSGTKEAGFSVNTKIEIIKK